jgi:hypothetical protein
MKAGARPSGGLGSDGAGVAGREDAYGLAQADDGPLRAWLSGHDGAGLTVTVDRLVLVAQRHDEREITWRPVGSALFGG